MLKTFAPTLFALAATTLVLSAGCGNDDDTPNTSGDVQYSEGTAEQCRVDASSFEVVHGSATGEDDYLVCGDGTLTYNGSSGDILIEAGGSATLTGTNINVYVLAGGSADVQAEIGDVFFENVDDIVHYNDANSGDIYHCDEILVTYGDETCASE